MVPDTPAEDKKEFPAEDGPRFGSAPWSSSPRKTRKSSPRKTIPILVKAPKFTAPAEDKKEFPAEDLGGRRCRVVELVPAEDKKEFPAEDVLRLDMPHGETKARGRQERVPRGRH